MSMELAAQLIGMYAIALLVSITVVVSGGIALLWRWLESSSHTLWRLLNWLWSAVVDLPPLVWLRRKYPWLWSFLGRRLSPQSYLGLHLTLGLILILVTVYLFAELAIEVGSNEEIARFDRLLVDSLYRHASPFALEVFLAITKLGDPRVLTVLGVATGLLLLVRRHWLLLASWIITLAGGGLLNTALKASFQRTRPSLPNPFLMETGWSFPSGHVMGSLIGYGMLAYLLVLALDRRWHPLIVVVTVSLILLIGASRMYLGVHYFSDVLAGYTAGTAWLATCVTGTEVARRHRRQR